MCSFNEVFDDLFPKSWLDPYGHMPMNQGLQASVDITVEKCDGVTKVTAVKTPPRSEHMSFRDALDMVLSITSCDIEPVCESSQCADLGKQEIKKDAKEICDSEICDEDQDKSKKQTEDKKKPW